MSRQPSDTFLYRGTSMWPCFQEGDLLEIVPLSKGKEIHRGDCLVWRDEQGRHVVHRVVGLRGGLQTRGDALPHNDLSGATREILGRVVRRYRFGRGSAVAGGFAGRLAGIFYHYAGRIDPERNARGGRLARTLRRLSTPLLRPWLKKGYRLGNEGEKQLSEWKLGGATLAARDPANGNWQTTWPWRVVIQVSDD